MEPEQEFVIRDYKPTDHEAVVVLNRYGLAAAGVPEDADIYSGDLDGAGEGYLGGRSAMLVGEVKGAIVAMGGLREIDDTDCEILRMRVRPEHQGRGFGRAILEALEARARRLDYTRAVLVTGPDQHPAIDLYSASGYEEVEVEQYGDLTGVRMVKQLS